MSSPAAYPLAGVGMLVDELRFSLHPAVWGEGAPYEGEKVRMRLIGSTSYDSGVALLRYEPAGRRGSD